MTDIIRYSSFSVGFTSLSVIISSCIHVAAKWHCGGGLVTKSSPTLSTQGTVAHQAPLTIGFFILFSG